jgi:predicted nucleic acid-binding protein
VGVDQWALVEYRYRAVMVAKQAIKLGPRHFDITRKGYRLRCLPDIPVVDHSSPSSIQRNLDDDVWIHGYLLSVSNEDYERASLRDHFPGYFPPDDDQVKALITHGMVAFDTNALLDIYRLQPHARAEYFAALGKLGDRLWIPHRVAQELLERRLSVIRECSSAIDVLAAELEKAFEGVAPIIRMFGNRRGLSDGQVAKLEQLATNTRNEIITQAEAYYSFELAVDSSLKGDDILNELIVLLDGKIGPPLADMKAAEAEAERRIEFSIPPGYRDAKKNPERAIGDYLIWRQLLNEATRRKLPVILVTNEQKSDWVWKELGRTLGARPELVAEMLMECSMPFHLVSVQSFLVRAQRHLGARVSESTVAQAAVDRSFVEIAVSQVRARTAEQMSALLDALDNRIGSESDLLKLILENGPVVDIRRDSGLGLTVTFANGDADFLINAAALSGPLVAILYSLLQS